MPHTWVPIFPQWPQPTQCFESWARACKQFGEGGKVTRGSYGLYIKAGDGGTEALRVQELTSLTPAKVLELMNESRRKKRQGIGHISLKTSL